MTIESHHVKVGFRLEVDEDGWPPVGVESVWAVDLGDATARLANTPWFVRGIANGDVLRTHADADGRLWAGDVVRNSENCTIRLIVLRDGGTAAARQSVLNASWELRVGGEGVDQFRMIALDVPPEADLRKVQQLLDHGESKGWWHVEEGCVTPAWTTARESPDIHS
ncbi:DUF4265 domain-containing protein [Streptomyces niveus]|uniref:DUF4265 domain-containing protein n=1 Tax=Streptomyces niveus TaxID=193462 RepID=A0A1U9QV85_STRNV|nr:DUF4265 domain-containing protein [Streptomyces niveus]AQU67731.1 hypothetical protein BBN63_17275 [Streptomyces niveus]